MSGQVLHLPPTARLPGLITALFLAAAAVAADEAYPPITPAEVKAGGFRPGERRSITGKYQELINRELKLYDVPARILIGGPHLSRQLLELKTERENLTVLGFFREAGPEEGDGPPLPLFEVERIEPAPTDVAIYRERLRKLLEDPDLKAEKLKGLGEEIVATLKRFANPALAPLVRQAYSEAFRRSELSMAGDDADGRLALIREIYLALPEADLTIDLLKSQARRFPDHEPTRSFLGKLRCMQVRGEWLTYPEYKRELGFVLRGKRWVKPVQKEFLDLLQQLQKERENQTNLILRAHTEREYRLLARSGNVEKGMNPEELTEALGLPDRVGRKQGKGFELDQWIYDDRRVYLLNGQVIATVP